MKTAISVPDDIFRSAENFAKEKKISRSALYARAVEEFIVHHRHEGVTEQLNELYSQEESKIDPVVRRLQSVAMPKGKW